MTARAIIEQAQQEFQGGIQPAKLVAASSALSVDWNAGETQQFTMTANLTLNILAVAPLAPMGSKLAIVLIQDATGTHTIGFGANVRNGPSLAAGAAGTRALIEFRFDGVNWQFVGGAAAFA